MTKQMTKKQAIKIVGGRLTDTTKMPCKSFGLPAQECNVGKTLVEVEGSVCNGCYALKGMYRFTKVQKAQQRRFRKIYTKKWVKALITMIGTDRWFRWHDSGDIHSLIHFTNMMSVIINTPDCDHWIPTREYNLIETYVTSGGIIPKNCYLRLSGYMVDKKPPTELAKRLNAMPNVRGFIGTSSVHKKKKASCPAHLQDNQCKDCRVCWSTKEEVSYKWH